jgi:hypothetical protein
MKYFLCILFLFPAFLLQAQSSVPVPGDTGTISSYGTLVLYRETGNNPRKGNIPVVLNDTVLTVLNAGEYFVYEGFPGLCVFGVDLFSDSILTIDLHAGELCFIRCRVEIERDTENYSFTLMAPDSADDYIAHNKLKPVEDQAVEEESNWVFRGITSPHLWLQINAGLGVSPGMISIDKYDASIEPGTNVFLGAELGYTYGKYIDISGSLGYHYTSASSSTDSLSINFTFVAIKTSCILHFPYGDRLRRINIGAGFGLDVFPRLKLQNSSAEGYTMRFVYGSAPVYHFQAEWERLLGSISLKAGLRLNYVSFSLNTVEMNRDRLPVDQPGFKDYKYVNASGGELYFGLVFHFIPQFFQ